MEKGKDVSLKKRVDWVVTFIPFITIIGIAVLLFIFPESSNDVISRIRFFFGDTLGSYYLKMG